MRLALIGYGSIGQSIAGDLTAQKILTSWLEFWSNRQPGSRGHGVCHRIEDLLERRPTVVIEAAGHEAIQTYGPLILRSGIDLADDRRNRAVPAQPSVAIIGAGIAGLTLGAALRKFGIKFTIYEQAAKFARVGAEIQLTPNATKLLRGFGLEPGLRAIGFAPQEGYNRQWDSGEVTFVHPMGAVTEKKYGAPDLSMHRGELHAILAALVPAEHIHFNKKLTDVQFRNGQVSLAFADGSTETAEALIGADGVHSRVREMLFGVDEPRFTGRVAYRAVFSTKLLGGWRSTTASNGGDRIGTL